MVWRQCGDGAHTWLLACISRIGLARMYGGRSAMSAATANFFCSGQGGASIARMVSDSACAEIRDRAHNDVDDRERRATDVPPLKGAPPLRPPIIPPGIDQLGVSVKSFMPLVGRCGRTEEQRRPLWRIRRSRARHVEKFPPHSGLRAAARMRRHREIRPPCGAEQCCPDREGGVESASKGAVSFCFSSEVDASAELRTSQGAFPSFRAEKSCRPGAAGDDGYRHCVEQERAAGEQLARVSRRRRW